MAKRVTLNKLFSYILKNCVHNGDSEGDQLENDINTLAKNKDLLEDLNFNNLKTTEMKNISDFPPKLKLIFDPFIKKLNRYGTIKTINESTDQNASLLYSVLFCLDDEFIDNSTENKIKQIIDLKRLLVKSLNGIYLFNHYGYEELGWKRKELFKSIRDLKNNRMMIRFLSDYFNINIFILDIQDDKIYANYPEKKFNIFKANLFLSFYNDIFEPIVCDDGSKLWDFKQEEFKKLINVDYSKINIFDDNFNTDLPKKIFEISAQDLDECILKLSNEKKNGTRK